MTSVPGLPDFIPMMRSLERDDFSSNCHPALSFCLSMISAQTLRVCREGKPVPTFPDHALNRADIGKALLRELHAAGDMAWLAAIQIEREHGLGAALLGPANHPAQRRLANLGPQQPGLGADDSIAGFGDGQDIANQFLAAL